MTLNTKLTFHYLGNEPDEANPCWDEDAQGVTHDRDFWYFTRQHLLVKMSITRSVDRESGESSTAIPDALWDYHKTHGLGDSLDDYVGAGYTISRARYDHFGDIDHFDGFLFIAMTGTAIWVDWNGDDREANMPPILAVFRADDLSLVGWNVLTGLSSAGWCAVNPKDGLLYTSDRHITADSPLKAYSIHWPALRNSEQHFLEFRKDVHLQLPHSLKHMQGGCFGPQRYLFLTNGYGTDFDVARGGIHVFDMDNGGRFVEKSSQSGEGLRFQFDPSLPKSEEPEGITWWDLDADDRAPRILGQLHAIMLDNDVFGDDVYFKHYRVRDVVEHAAYLKHMTRSDLPLPAVGSWALAAPTDLMFIEGRRCFLDGNSLVCTPRDIPPSEALASGDKVLRLDLSATLADVGIGPRRSPLSLSSIDDHMWIPLSGDHPAVLVLNDQFDTVGIWAPPDGGPVAWVAINPRNRELYAGPHSTSVVQRYAVDWDNVHREGELRSTHLGNFRLVDAVGRERVVNQINGACVAPEGHVLYFAAIDGLSAYAVRGGRIVDASHDEMLEIGKGPSFDGRPSAGEQLSGVAVQGEGNELIVETLLRQSDGSIHWLQFTGSPNQGSVGVGFIGNRSSKEVHKRHCVWVSKMNEKNKVFFDSPLTAAEQGYDGCRTCLRFYNTG